MKYQWKKQWNTQPQQQLCRKAQVTLEVAVALIVLFLFLYGAVRIFDWGVTSIITRQRDFQGTRREAGNPNLTPGKGVSRTSDIRIFE